MITMSFERDGVQVVASVQEGEDVDQVLADLNKLFAAGQRIRTA
jgi:hypothetical protein